MSASDKPALLSVEQARDFLLSRAVAPVAVERVALAEALGRVLAEGVVSPLAVPAHDNSAMDGFAVRSAEIPKIGETVLPVSQRIPAGHHPEPLAPGSAARIFTGAPIPPGADAVVMQEKTRMEGGRVVIRGPVKPEENLRRAGEDIAAGSAVLTAGIRLRPQELGLAASVGAGELTVYRRLRVALFSTGDELAEPGEPLAPGQIYNSNRSTLRALLAGLGCEVVDLGRVADTAAATREALARGAAEADAVIASGGVSVGEEDHVKGAVEALGALDLWKINVKPGKPLAFGQVAGKPFLGLPGNPVSSFVTFLLFARPFLLRAQGVAEVVPRSLPVRADFDWPKPGKRREYARVRLQPGSDGTLGAALFPHQGSGVLTSTSWADGLAVVPEGVVVRPGTVVEYLPFAELIG